MGGLKIVFGTAGFNPDANFPDVESQSAILNLLAELGVKNLDTAQLYGESETALGATNAGERFIIDTKAKGGFDAGNSLQPDTLYKLAHESLAKLKVKQVDIFYIHAPDETIPVATWVPVIDKLHKEGLFKRFGLSNFPAPIVKDVYSFAKEKGFVLPTAFQGNYSPVARRQETELLPTLRELGIAFYAYSPLAGGFLTKTKESMLDDTAGGRFSGDTPLAKMYRTLYVKPAFLEALEEWAAAAEEQGVSKAELAYRWVSYHSPLKPEQGDAIIFGARNLEQTKQTVEGLQRGPLKPAAVAAIDKIWEKIKHEAPLDNYNSFAKHG